MDKLPKVSIVVCTKDRPQLLTQCLKSLIKSKYENYEIIIVDNNSQGNETRKVASQFPVRYFLEKKPGQPCAANHGIREAKGEIIAITDDDCVVEANWLNLLANNFRNPEVGCCTGLVLPFELKTKAQKLFEEYQEFSIRNRRVEFTKESKIPFFPVNAFRVGDGTNMAFRKNVLTSIGGFDEELDVGTFGKLGGEIFAFFKVLASGWKIVYDPSSKVWHSYRPTYRDLIKNIYNSGVSCQFYLIKCISSHFGYRLTAILYSLIWFPYQPVRFLRKFLRKPKLFFFIMNLVECVGFLMAPVYWYRSKMAIRRRKQYEDIGSHCHPK